MMFFPESLKRRQRFLEELEKKAAEKVEKVEEKQTVEEKQPEVVVENKIQDTSEVVVEAAPLPDAPEVQQAPAPEAPPKKKRGRRKKTAEQQAEAANAEDDADDDDDDDNAAEEVKQ